MTQHYARLVLGAVCAGAAVVLGAVVVMPLASDLEEHLLPPMHGWRVTAWQVDGRDVVLTGTVIKTRACSYIPPPRARDENGQNYLVSSSAPAPTASWDASPRPQRFGPWRVAGGAGKQLIFYQEFRCHAGWNVVVEHGTLDTRTKE